MNTIQAAPLSDYFGLWSIHRADHLAHTPFSIGLGDEFEPKPSGFEMIAPGVALIDITGFLMKYPAAGFASSSTIMAQHVLAAAVDDPFVRTIIMKFDSAGGTVAGTIDMAAAIVQAKSKKSVIGFIEDLCAGSAYCVASQCSKLYANNETALIGSIGTCRIIYDSSKAAGRAGRKVHVIRSGEYKGTGVPGTELTAKHLAEENRIVSSTNSEFFGTIAIGRGVLRHIVANDWGQGKTYPAVEASERKIIDGIQTLEQILTRHSS